MLPYGKQALDQDDIDAVIDALKSDWLTTGPRVEALEKAFAEVTQTRSAVALNSGTAALHAAMHAAEIAPTDEVIVPAISFVATANAAVYLGANPVFADVDQDTLRICPDNVRQKITSRTKAIVAMDYGGQPCDYVALRRIADENGLILIADACHSLGGSVDGAPVGSLADYSCFSLHPVKQITAGEGGIVVTNHTDAADKIRAFRNHGISTDHRQREQAIAHQYAMKSLGFNYRLTDIQCALGLSQLGKLERFTRRRNDVARYYRQLLSSCSFAQPLKQDANLVHAYHLFVIRWNQELTGVTRDEAFQQMRARGIGVNVHYEPIYRHPFYLDRFGDQTGCCPNAERVYGEILSLPIFPEISQSDVERVVKELKQIAEPFSVTNSKVA